jgi:hypothetical protein
MGARTKNKARHPDCRMRTSLVVCTIALTPVVSTYRPRGEQFAGTISTVVLVSDVRNVSLFLVWSDGKFSDANTDSREPD